MTKTNPILLTALLLLPIGLVGFGLLPAKTQASTSWLASQNAMPAFEREGQDPQIVELLSWSELPAQALKEAK